MPEAGQARRRLGACTYFPCEEMFPLSIPAHTRYKVNYVFGRKGNVTWWSNLTSSHLSPRTSRSRRGYFTELNLQIVFYHRTSRHRKKIGVVKLIRCHYQADIAASYINNQSLNTSFPCTLLRRYTGWNYAYIIPEVFVSGTIYQDPGTVHYLNFRFPPGSCSETGDLSFPVLKWQIGPLFVHILR